MDLTAFTIAFWMRSDDKTNEGTVLSYAVDLNGVTNDNALTLYDYSAFDLSINNETVALECDANDGEWHHIAVSWKSSDGSWQCFKDGSLISRCSMSFSLITPPL